MAPRPPGWRLRRTWGQRLFIGAGAMAASLSLVVAGLVLVVRGKATQIQRVTVGFGLSPSQAGAGGESSQAVNILVVGVDNAEGLAADDRRRVGREDGLRSDTIMLVRLDPVTGLAAALSFPRDLWLPLGGGGGRERINAALPLGGPELLLRTVTENFAVPIDHYVEVDFAQFRELVNVVGGVPMPFDRPVRDDNSGLYVGEPGCVLLDGDAALDYVRSRYLQYLEDGEWRPDGFADLSRIRRQQDFIRRALRRAQAKGLGNPFTANALIDVGLNAVTVDESFTAAEMISLAQRFRGLDPAALLTFSLPTEPFETEGGAQVLDLLTAQAEPLFDIFRGKNPDGPAAVTVAVHDPTRSSGAAAALGGAGFIVVPEPSGDAVATSVEGLPAQTTLRFRPIDRYRADSLARWLAAPPRLEELDEDLGVPGQVELLVGSDYGGVLAEPRPAPSHWQPAVSTVGVLPGEGDLARCG